IRLLAGSERPGSINADQKVETPCAQTVPIHEMGSADAIAAEPIAVPETAINPVFDYASSSEALPESQKEMVGTTVTEDATQEPARTSETFVAPLPVFLFSGFLLGLLPMWNSAVFIPAAAILGLLFILCPQRLQMIGLGLTAGLIALP